MRFNRFILSCLGGCVCFIHSYADTIITKEGDEIEGTVISISQEDLTYTAPASQVKRIISLNKILLVKYANGEKEIFNTSTPDAPRPKAELTDNNFFPIKLPIVIPTDYSGYPPASRRYRIGDFYNENGLMGIVVHVTEDGRHGKIMAMKEIGTASTMLITSLPEEVSIGCTSLINGVENTKLIKARLRKIRKLNGSRQRLLEKLDEYGDGWYIPSYGELLQLAYTVTDEYDKSVLKQFNDKIKEHGAQKLNKYAYYSSSSEKKVPNKNVYAFGFVHLDDNEFRGYTEAMTEGYRCGNTYRFFHIF